MCRVHAERVCVAESMRHGVSAQKERGVHSMGCMRREDECACGVGCPQDSESAQRCQGMHIEAGDAWHKLWVCRKLSLPV